MQSLSSMSIRSLSFISVVELLPGKVIPWSLPKATVPSMFPKS